MEYRNLLNFGLCLLLIVFLNVSIAFVNSIITSLAVTFFVIKLAEWFTEITRKYILYKKVSPKNKVVLITGCDTGFGNALARRMDKLGYSVLATCLDADGEGAKKLSQDCSEKLRVLQMDIRDEQSIEKVKAFVEKNVERNALWAVVNNAGIMQVGPVDWTPVEEFQKTCDVNTFGALRVTKAFLPFIKRSKGRIVNVTSTAGRYAIPGVPAYSLSKSAAVSLATSLQVELIPWGIKCISIEPYMFATHLADKRIILEMAKKTWNATPLDVKSEYGEDYYQSFQILTRRILSLAASSRIYRVIDCLEDAITAEDPLPIYVPANFFERILLLLYVNLPLGMPEYIIACVFSLFLRPLALRRKKKIS